MKRIVIFDLDGTVIDSSHRTPNNPDGTLNIEKYFKNRTRENIMRDTLLPLANTMKSLCKKDNYIIICTARDLTEADWEYLTVNKLKAHKIISRNPDGSEVNTTDIEHKGKKLNKLLNLKQFQNKPVFFFDDATPILSHFRKIKKFTMINATKTNKKLAA